MHMFEFISLTQSSPITGYLYGKIFKQLRNKRSEKQKYSSTYITNTGIKRGLINE